MRRKLVRELQIDEQTVKQYLMSKYLVQFVTIQDETERTLFEHFAIAILGPKHND